MRNLALALALTTALLTACAAPGPSSTSLPAEQTSSAPKKVAAGIRCDAKTLAVVNACPGAGEVLALLRSSLFVQDDRNVLVTQLGEAVPMVENGLWVVRPDGSMETTVRIREGARWHDGTPLTADDLVFSVDVRQDKDIPLLSEVGLSFLERVTAVDARTVSAQWKQTYILADTLFSAELAPPMPKHLLHRQFTENKADFTNLPYWSDEFVGTGPFRLQDWVIGSHIKLAANPDYVLGRPRVDEIDVKFVPDPNVLTASILADAVDLALGRSLSLDQAMQVRDQWRSGRVTVNLGGRIAIVPQFLNPSPAVIGDVRFRRALIHATDRQEQADSLQGGLSRAADSFMDPDQAEYAEVEASVPRYPYDLRRATELMQELGYARDGSGAWRGANGQPLAVEMRTSQGDDLQEKGLFSTADYWRRFGVATETVVVPQQRQTDREYRATRGGFELYRQPGDLPNIGDQHGSQTPTAENNYAGRNRSRYQNPEFDALLDRYFVTISKPERIRVVGQIIHHISDQLTIMGLFYNVSPGVVSHRLVGVGERRPAWNGHQWDVK